MVHSYLYMSNGVLAGNCDGILGPHHRNLVEERIPDGFLDLLDLFDGLFVVKPVKEEVNIRCRAELLMVVLAQLTFSSVE